MHVIPFVIICIYMGLLYLISWYCTKLTKGGAEGYLLAGRGFPAGVVAVMLAGLAVGGASTVGVAENAFQAGISAGWYNGAWAAGGIVVGLVAAARYRKWTISTVPELFERYYSTGGRVLGVIAQLTILIVITSMQYLAGGAILAALLPQYFTFQSGMVVSALVFIGITLIGGMWAAGLTNVLNVIVIYIGVGLGSIVSVLHFGGFQKITAALPATGQWFHPFSGVGLAIIAAWFVVMITQTFSAQGPVQIAFAAKDSRAARNGFLLGGLIIFPVGFLAALFGIVGAAVFPDINPTMALPQVVLSLNPVLAGLTLAGLWAADVSTACGLLLGCSNLVVGDILKRYLTPNLNAKQEVLVSRMVTLIVSVITFMLALSVAGILQTLVVGLTLTTAFTVVLLFTMFLPKICKKSCAFWTLLAGIVQLAVWQFVPATHIVPHPIYLAWPVCIAAFLITAALDKNPATIDEAV